MELQVGEGWIKGLKKINVLLGRNGAGKSRYLRALDAQYSQKPEFNIRYISPERAGVFQRDGNVLTNMERDPQWLRNVRGKNQADNFKAASANLLREIETTYLRRLQDTPSIRSDHEKNFRVERLEKINGLLLNISIVQEGSDFHFCNSNGEIIPPDQISSGESEAVALAAEIMYFFENIKVDRDNILLLDEPDVHLHPDLQARLAKFLIGMVDELDENIKSAVTVILATHSTPLVCALTASNSVAIGTKEFGLNTVEFSPIADQLTKIAPFFGHPLSLTLSKDVMLILEGEDDERVWQQAARSSQGRIKLFPVLSSGVKQQTQLEEFCAPLLKSLYDDPIAFSLRDGDGNHEKLQPIGPVLRYRLDCYSIENLLLTDEALLILGLTWDEFHTKASTWMSINVGHKDHDFIEKLIASSDRLQNSKIKDIRQLICTIAGTQKPWEVVVGQAIGSINLDSMATDIFNLATFIGVDTIQSLLGVRTNR